MPPTLDSHTPNHSNEPVRRALLWYAVATLSLFALALTVVAVRGLVFHLHYPYDTILFDPGYRFSDFSMFAKRFLSWSRGDGLYRSFAMAYFPAQFFVFAPFCAAAGWSIMPATYLYVGFAAASMLAVFVLFLRRLLRVKPDKTVIAAAVVGVVCSYPILFVLDRANIEVTTVLCSLTGVWLFFRQRYRWAAVAIAAAGAMKFAPAILFLLFLPRRLYKEMLIGALTFALLTVVGLAAAGPTVTAALASWRGEMADLTKEVVMANAPKEIGFDHCAFSCIKQIAVVWRHGNEQTPPKSIIKQVYPWYVFASLLVFFTLYYTRIRRLPALNQLFALITVQLLFQPFSADYKLLHLYIPWGAFLFFLATDVLQDGIPFTRAQALSFLLPCAVLFTPQSFLLYREIGFGGQVKAIALALLLLAALRTPLRSRMFDSSPEDPAIRQDLRWSWKL